MLNYALDPASIAIIGASDNPHKVGGRPILYLKRYGYRGAIYPVNAARQTVQDLAAYPDIGSVPKAPELAIVAVAGEEAVRAVEACAARGVKVAVVMTSGFGETGEAGRKALDRMLAAATRAGMRLIGPNCQGIANFATGAVANFSTIFHELEGRDGPVAIVSQSGANSQAIYQLVREKGLGVRHVHATGNEADVTVADLAAAVIADPGVRLVLLYMEAIKDPAALARVAEQARSRDLPIVALKAGRSASGQKAASTHTGALATEDRLVDAFFERHAIWRAADPHQLVSAAELYVSGRRPRGKRLVFISNSGASCVMAADYADERGIPLASVPKEKLKSVLPPFAADRGRGRLQRSGAGRLARRGHRLRRAGLRAGPGRVRKALRPCGGRGGAAAVGARRLRKRRRRRLRARARSDGCAGAACRPRAAPQAHCRAGATPFCARAVSLPRRGGEPCAAR
jgi:acyl-CoA synthetase (NDP forming)